jgi:hypothetical protein
MTSSVVMFGGIPERAADGLETITRKRGSAITASAANAAPGLQ